MPSIWTQRVKYEFAIVGGYKVDLERPQQCFCKGKKIKPS